MDIGHSSASPAPGTGSASHESGGGAAREWTCTIVTTAANPLVATVHDRMPVILTREGEAAWLSVEVDAQEALTLLQPYPAEAMQARLASRDVGSIPNDHPGLLEPFAIAV